jgi:transposase-like protein
MDPERRPVPGVDYPRTFQEFDVRFPDEAACREYLVRLRWPTGFECPACGSRTPPWLTARGLMQCQDCWRQTSVMAGTVFEGTHKPLRTWFLAMWFVTSQKHGASALGVQRVLGLGSYETAWAWLHKLRRAMVRPGRDRLTGAVEVDEVYLGGPEAGGRGRATEAKAIVAVAAEKRDRATGRIRLRHVTDVSAKSLFPFVSETIAPGSVVHTDGWSGYAGLDEGGYRQQVTNIKRSGRPAHELMPRVHKVASLLKRWLLGIHHGGVQPQHLAYYLDEFTFRFNRRTSRSRGLLFYRLIQQAALTEPTLYRALVGGQAAVHPQPVVVT